MAFASASDLPHSDLTHVDSFMGCIVLPNGHRLSRPFGKFTKGVFLSDDQPVNTIDETRRARLEMLIKRFGGKLADLNEALGYERTHSLASQLFNHFGLAKAFGISLQLSRPEHPSVLGWSYLTGNQAQGAEVKALLDNYRKNTRAEVPDGLFPVLTEAMTNVRQHAYTDDLTTPVDLQRWWLFARHEKPGGDAPESLYIAIYDIGYGIPATMRNQLNTPEKIVGFLDKAGKASTLTHGTALDQRLLYAAVEDKRSQTGHPYRGNGLPEMREFVADSTNGRLHIVSGLAQYSFVQGQTDGQTEGFKQKFPGTLLLWGLVLKTKEISP